MLDATLGSVSYGKAVANGVGAAILVVGVFMALNQLQIAPAIVSGLFYALLAIIVGVTVIAVGGGGIGPMRTALVLVGSVGWYMRLTSGHEDANYGSVRCKVEVVPQPAGRLVGSLPRLASR